MARGRCAAPTALALGILISVHPSVVLSSEIVRSEQRLSQETESDHSEPGEAEMLTTHRVLVTTGG